MATNNDARGQKLMSAQDIEDAIDHAYMRMCTAETSDERRKWLDQMNRLKAMRAPEDVERMEADLLRRAKG